MNQSGRHKKEYIGDNLDLKVYPKDSVPENRPHGSWTKGMGTRKEWFFRQRSRLVSPSPTPKQGLENP